MQDKKDVIRQAWRSFVNAQRSVGVLSTTTNEELKTKLDEDCKRFDAQLTALIKDFLDEGGTVGDIG